MNALDQAGRLVKVFGGAVAKEMAIVSEEPSVKQKMDVNMEQKRMIYVMQQRWLKPVILSISMQALPPD